MQQGELKLQHQRLFNGDLGKASGRGQFAQETLNQNIGMFRLQSRIQLAQPTSRKKSPRA
jgi:hypothetical protein